jgi:hypothetical protein
MDEAMRGLVVSAEPAVVLSSLARTCNPAFSDSCTIELSEGLDALFRVTFPMTDEEPLLADSGLVAAGDGTPPAAVSTVSTSFQAASTLGYPSFAGVVLYSWIEREPSENDAIIARLLVDRAVAVVHLERLAQAAARADERAAKLALDLITSRIEGEAIGVLMTKHKVTREEVLRFLRWVSRTSQRELHEVATDVVRGDDLKWPGARGADDPGRRRNLHAL